MKNNNKYDSVMLFNEKQIEAQLKKQIEFLRKIYPWLEEDSYQEGAIEIRAIKRDKDTKYLRSYNTWRLEDKDINNLRKFLCLVNGGSYCLYYSVFAFDYSLETNSKEKGKINKDNALFTSILAIDFDDMTEDEFQEEKVKLLKVGIETVDVFSGHGFQSIILLKEKVYDKNILTKFTNLIVSKGIKGDLAIVDCARLMRLSFTFNCKTFDPKNKHFGEGVVPCQLFTDTDKRYKLIEVFEKINTMKDVIKSVEEVEQVEVDFKNIKIEPINYVEKQKKIKEVQNIKIENLKSLYRDYLDIDKLPEPVQKMLQGSQEGLRNKVLLFIIPFLRKRVGLNIQTVKSVLKIWGELCIPSLSNDFVEREINRLYKYDFKAAYGKYTEELRTAYGYLEFDKYTRANKIIVPNEFFEEFNIINDCAVKIYLSMKLAVEQDELREFTKEDIQRVANVVEKTVERNMKDLVVQGYVCKRRSNRRGGEKYIYYINSYFNKTKGFTILENATVRLMLKELTDGEIKLYTYLCSMINSADSDCWASQKYLAKAIDKKGHSSISKMTDKLVEKRYIKKTAKQEYGIIHCTYNLVY